MKQPGNIPSLMMAGILLLNASCTKVATPQISSGPPPGKAQEASECPVHHLALVKITGYDPGQHTDADPSWDYIRFMAGNEKRFPYTKPWSLHEKPESGWNDKHTSRYCPKCEEKMTAAYETYRKLDESTKDTLFSKALEHQTENPWSARH